MTTLEEALRESHPPLLSKSDSTPTGLGVRASYHVTRLLYDNRGKIETSFGEALRDVGRQALRQVKEQYSQGEIIDFVMNSEGTNITMWWTIAPFLHDLQIQGGRSPQESLRRLMQWVEQSDITLTGGVNDLFLDLKLTGLEDLAAHPKFIHYALPHNPKSATHRFTAEVARQVFETVKVFSDSEE